MTEKLDELINTDSDEGLTLGLYAEKAYLDYAVSVVKGRALPELSDGQKPVQRRILYAMNDMGLVAGSKHVKSARVVGDVLGKYHPHGDQAAYDAMVRMAQDFTLRYPLIDGQGNFGSQDGDGAAAMRYTEARLTPISSLLLDEIREGTVDFVDNYDGSQREPALLPARLPFVLLNGASGIAVGMATEIPSHHIGEVAQGCVALLKNPELTEEELLTYIQGPDFAGGGQIISSAQDIAQVYRSGKGSIRVRAKWHIEPLARGQWQLVVTQLPPNTSSRKILEEIEDLANPKLKNGKKRLTQEQQQQKALILSLLDTVRDEADRNSPIRLVFEPKSSRVDQTEFVNTLLAKTGLEANVSINLVCIGTDGRPAQKNLLTILQEWTCHRLGVLTRRTQYRLDRINERLHILEGRQIVYLNVEQVIACIRQSDAPKMDLMSTFGLTQEQAEDILEMRLRQLAKLEGFKIEQEIEEKRQQKDYLEQLLSHPQRMKGLLIQEIQDDLKRFGDQRRTLIQQADRAVQEQKVVDEPVTVVASTKGWLRQRQGHCEDMDGLHFKAGDELKSVYWCRSVDDLLVFDVQGRVYTIAVSNLPSIRADGAPISSLVDLQSPFHHVMVNTDSSEYLIAQSAGYGFVVGYDKLKTKQKSGKQFVDVQERSQLLAPLELTASVRWVGLLSKNRRLLIIEVSELKRLDNGGLGTILMNLDEGDCLEQIIPITEQGMKLSGVYRKKRIESVLSLEELTPYMGKRARKGKFFETKVRQPNLFGF